MHKIGDEKNTLVVEMSGMAMIMCILLLVPVNVIVVRVPVSWSMSPNQCKFVRRGYARFIFSIIT